jgi:O-antigen/teichoic acid export membrane protein
MGSVGLIASHVLGYVYGIFDQSKDIWAERQIFISSKISNIKGKIKEESQRQAYASIAALANGLSYSLIAYFIKALYTDAQVGYYGISYKILGLPLTIIGANISKIFIEKAVKEHQKIGNFKMSFKQTMMILFALSIPIFIGLEVLSPWVCEKFLGKEWRTAGIYVRILAPLFVSRFIASGVNTSTTIVKKQKSELLIQITITIICIGVFFYTNKVGLEIEDFLKTLSVGFTICYIAAYIIYWKCAVMSDKE